MSKLTISEGIEINNLENVLEGIRIITGKEGDAVAMKRFINQEQSTRKKHVSRIWQRCSKTWIPHLKLRTQI